MGRITKKEVALVDAAVLDMLRVGSFFGRQPSQREMSDWLGYSPDSGPKMVSEALGRLQAAGAIRRGGRGKNTPGTRCRAIELLGPQPGRRCAYPPDSGG